MSREGKYVRWFEEVGSEDVGRVGGKNASLGEMIRNLKDKGIQVPDGFATTAEAYRKFIEENHTFEVVGKAMKVRLEEIQATRS